jgi:signal transduction histidine kinase
LFTEQKAKNKFVSTINATVSHELRNPLNSIIAKNIEKKKLYEQLIDELKEVDSLVSTDKVASYHIKYCMNLVEQLQDG